MVKKTRWLSCFLTLLLIFLSASPVSAAPSPSSPSTTGFTIWPSKSTTEVNKVWAISFNNPLLSTSVNSNTIYVTDSKQKKVATKAKLSTDGLSVSVTPSGAYAAGDYNLYITNGVTSQAGVKLGEMIIVPFTVTPLIGSSLVVKVTYDTKSLNPSDLSGSLSLEDPNGNGIGPSSSDYTTGKYTFNIYLDGDYLLKYYSVTKGILTTQTIKIPKIKLPTTGTAATKTVNFTLATQAGVDSGKSGTIGGTVTPEAWGVPVKISNTTSTWTTTTDTDGKFMVYLPTGSYTLFVDGNDDSLYKRHSYKMTVTGGQMASPLELINLLDPINKLGLNLTTPAADNGSGELSGIDITTKEIDGTVNSDATIYIYDTVPSTPVLITKAKPDKNGIFKAKLPSNLTGKKLQLQVMDASENVYTLDMPSIL